MRETMAVLREQSGHDLVPHVMMSNFDSRPLFVRRIMAELDEEFGRELLDTVIHHTVRFREAAGEGAPVIRHDPESRGAMDFRDLARELGDQEVDLEVRALDHWEALLHGPRVVTGGILFEADFPSAKRVAVTGDFCSWSTGGLPMRRRDDGVWECRLELGSGQHQYRFIVDGTWLPDPSNDQTVANEFGGANSVVLVT